MTSVLASISPAVNTPAVRYPAGQITKHGAYYLLDGEHPDVKLRAYDGSISFALMGPEAIPNRDCPECALITDLTGLIPPWQTVDQKGATEDGITFLDALYDPIEVDMTVMCRGRDGARTRKVVRDLIASIDAKQTSPLSWFTQDLGYWWADLRWLKGRPSDKYVGSQKKRQPVTLVLRADNGFWKSFDHVDEFRFTYDTFSDAFGYTTTQGMSTDWAAPSYSPAGGGFVRVVDGQLVFVPTRTVQPQAFTVACRHNGATTTNNQVVQVTLGDFPGWFFPEGAAVDLLARQNQTGTPGSDTIRARIEVDTLTISSVVNGVEKDLRSIKILPPMPGETFTLVCGTAANSRLYEVLRGGGSLLTVIESGTASRMGAGFCGTGVGFYAAAEAADAVPPALRNFSAGDNTTQTQSGYVTRINIGDQPMFDRYTLFGPGIFVISNGIGAKDTVTFGPLLPGQIMQLRTDPRKAGVVDLLSPPSTPQDQAVYNTALEDYLSFASANNTPALFSQITSIAGTTTTQGNPFSLFNGRFSDAAAIPAKSPGHMAVPQKVGVTIENGNADSAILVAGTPLRRYPL